LIFLASKKWIHHYVILLSILKLQKGEGHRILYDREVPFELRIHDDNGPQEVGTLEAIRVKVLVLV
jgi:hypothetical protein